MRESLLLAGIVDHRKTSEVLGASAALVQIIVRAGQSALCRTKMVIGPFLAPHSFPSLSTTSTLCTETVSCILPLIREREDMGPGITEIPPGHFFWFMDEQRRSGRQCHTA